jgi:hypothetical protein
MQAYGVAEHRRRLTQPELTMEILNCSIPTLRQN